MTLLLSAALAFVVVEMSVTYLVARRLRNFGIVDVVWSLGFGPIAALFYLVAYVALLLTGSGRFSIDRIKFQ